MTTETISPAAVDIDGEPTALYRLYDADDTLLYVGITRDLSDRFTRHEADKDWWPQVARKTAMLYGSRTAALAAESTAILAEFPLHNKAGRRPKRIRKQSRAGRPAIGGAVLVRLGKDLLADVDAYAREHDVKRAEAIRTLLEAALKLQNKPISRGLDL